MTYVDNTNGQLRTARYVASGGTGCDSSAWTCTSVNAAGEGGADATIVFDLRGGPWIGYYDNSGTDYDFNVATVARGGEITLAPGLAGASGDSHNESHSDMTAVPNNANRDDADCVGGGTWNNGKWFETEEASGFSLPAGATTAQCTEVSFIIDTSQAAPGATYRFVIAGDDGWRADNGRWRGPASVTNYPTLTIEADTTVRISKGVAPAFTNCSITSWGCSSVSSTGDVGKYTSTAFDSDGNAWISYYDVSNGDLIVARYVGTGGNCTSATWMCTSVDTANDVGQYASIAVDAVDPPG